MRRLSVFILAAFALTCFAPSVARASAAAPGAPAASAPSPYRDVTHPSVLTHRAVRRIRHYRVRGGDTLSSIAKRKLGHAWKWEGLYAANRATVGRSPNVITKGERLRLATAGVHGIAARMIARALRPPPSPRHARPAAAAAAPEAAAPASAPASPSAPAAVQSGGGYPGGAFGACVVARESGGNSQVMNASGHYGLYQFSESTWVAYGGSPGDFGHATVGEQEAVFMSALAQGGQSNWSPYDGC